MRRTLIFIFHSTAGLIIRKEVGDADIKFKRKKKERGDDDRVSFYIDCFVDYGLMRE
jgi:hypothetical protein